MNQLDPKENLDDLLARAAWPEPTDESTQRLERYYAAHRKRKTVLAGIGFALAAAAAVGFAVGLGVMVEQRAYDDPPIASVAASIEEQGSTPGRSPEARKGNHPGREPTAYELLVFHAHERRRMPSETNRVSSDQIDAAVRDAIEQLNARPGVHPLSIASQLAESAPVDRIESRLHTWLSSAAGPDVVAIVRLLSEIGTWRSLPMLLDAAHEPSLRQASISGLIRLADAPTLERLARRQSNPLIQRRLLAAILGRDAAVAVPIYLKLVRLPELEAQAMSALDLVASPPVDVLLAHMADARIEVRFAAARVLGRVADRPTLRRIVPLIDEPALRREAMLALLWSRDPEARHAVRTAAHDPKFAALIRDLNPYTQEPDYDTFQPATRRTL